VSVLVILEQRGGKWNRVSFEAIAAAQKIAAGLNTDVRAVVPGHQLYAVAAEAARYGVGAVLTLDDAALGEYTPDAWTDALEPIIRDEKASAVVLPHTYQVRDYAPKLATRFSKVLISDVVDVRVEGGSTVCVRQLFQGKLQADMKPEGEPVFLSVQAGAFRAAEPGESQAPIQNAAVSIDPGRVRSKPEAPYRETQRSVDLSSANLIVAVGRGIQNEDKLRVVQELADVLGAELAASRPICDNGWLPMERQVGSSGQTVAPKVYFAIGISGAIQHLVGMKGSKTVVAINKDESAPIFETADYAVVGDLFEIVPALIEEIKKVKA
jgi:electron transfer flavoprotein alpha subunit